MLVPISINPDPQATGAQYLEDLSTAYWASEVLFAAVELEVFTILEPDGKSAAEVAAETGLDRQATERFLQTLCALGLLVHHGGIFFNTRLSSDYLVKGKPAYQGEAILWRKFLAATWQDLKACLKAGRRVNFPPADEERADFVRRVRRYVRAMDGLARIKTKEILDVFVRADLRGKLLDVGSGSGALAKAFLERFPGLQATLLDLPEVLAYAKELLHGTGLDDRITYCEVNVLEPWPLGRGEFALVLLSNIVHAYSEPEVYHLLANAVSCLEPGGFLVVHDFFSEHRPAKAALFDLNMLVNTYNGRVFSAAWLRDRMASLGLAVSELIPLSTDTALLVGTLDPKRLEVLAGDPKSRLAASLESLGFRGAYPISPQIVHVRSWVPWRCRYGCELYARPECPPNSPPPEKTRELLSEYTQALLLEGEPPLSTFQRLVLHAEREAFKAGFYKAFAFWAGPCSLCISCSPDGICRRPEDARPSMEAAGIDVFATVRRAGLSLRPLQEKNDFVKYFALLLLE